MSKVSIVPRGMDFVRFAIALAVNEKGSSGQIGDAAAGYAEHRWGALSAPARFMRAAVQGGSTVPDATWGQELTYVNAAASEFYEAVSQVSIVGRLLGAKRIPLRTRLLKVTGNSSAYWVSEGAPKPLSGMTFGNDSLEAYKVASLIVVSDELLRSADPAAEGAIRTDLLRAAAEAIDAAFLSTTNAGVEGERPKSITHGITPITATSNPTASLKALVASFTGDLTQAVWIMQPQIAAALHGADHPAIGLRGGELLGAPAATSRSAPANAIILADVGGLAIGEGSAEIRTSRQSAIQFLDNPTNDSTVPTATTTVSLWQVDSTAILAERAMNWTAGRSGAVSLITGVNWPAP